MTQSLQFLLREISHTPDKNYFRTQVLVKLGNYFEAKRWGLLFFEDLPPQKQLSGLLKLALSLEYNPVLRYIIEHHAPVHEGIILSPAMWQKICPRADHGHVMAGPIVSQGQLVGIIGFTRNKENLPFDAQNLVDLSALCLHLSTWLVTLQIESTRFNELNIQRLTPRQIEIAKLVAKGLTNADIGVELWITENSVKQALKRIFRKLAVSSRAEMVAQLINIDNNIS